MRLGLVPSVTVVGETVVCPGAVQQCDLVRGRAGGGGFWDNTQESMVARWLRTIFTSFLMFKIRHNAGKFANHIESYDLRRN